MKLLRLFALFLYTSIVAQATAEKAQPIEVKVVVITMFEVGQDSGDVAGEFQLWKEKQKLDTRFAFLHSHHDIFMNTNTGVLGIVTGMGTAKSASAIMALGLDERFDLSHAYWLVAGIAGVDPADASIGSAAWASWLVDGDLAHQIDRKEAPQDWQTGYFPLFSHRPFEGETLKDTALTPQGEVFQLNTKLSRWAYDLTKNITLPDYPAMRALRNKYVAHPNARKAPFVLLGDHVAASTFWHGVSMTMWANDWTQFWTNNKGNFVTSGMEDTGSFQAMEYLHRAGKANKARFMVLRTGSNYSMPPKGLSAAQNLEAEMGENGFAGFRGAIESAYLVGSKVVNTLVQQWPHTKHKQPYEDVNK